jgi:hypothetical protein
MKHDFSLILGNSVWSAISPTEENRKLVPLLHRRCEVELGQARENRSPYYYRTWLFYLQEKNASSNSHAVCQRPTTPRSTNKWRPRTTTCFFTIFIPLFLLAVSFFPCIPSNFPFPLALFSQNFPKDECRLLRCVIA